MPSSVIRSMQYHPRERTLDIAFRDGRGVYRYFDVPEREWQAFRSAPSKGTYLNQTFKAHSYGYEKLPLRASLGNIPPEEDASTEQKEGIFWGESPSGSEPPQ